MNVVSLFLLSDCLSGPRYTNSWTVLGNGSPNPHPRALLVGSHWTQGQKQTIYATPGACFATRRELSHPDMRSQE